MLICDILFPFTLYDTGAIFSNNLLPEILSRKSSIFSLSITVLPSCGINFTTASAIDSNISLGNNKVSNCSLVLSEIFPSRY